MHQWGMCAQKEPHNQRKILLAERSDRNRLENATGLHAKVFLFWPLYCTALQCQPSASQKTTYFPAHPYHEYSYHKQHTMKKPWQMEVACSPFHHVSYFCYSPFQKRGGKKSFAQPWNVENPQLYYSTLGVIFAATMFSYHIAENKQTNKKILTWLQETLSISSDPGTSELSVKDSAFSTSQPNWSVLKVEVSPMAGFKWFQDSLSANTVQKQHDV